MSLAATGGFALSLSQEKQIPSMETVADRLAGADQQQVADQPEHTASVQVATVDAMMPDQAYGSAISSDAQETPAQESALASMPADTAAPSASPGTDARAHETELAESGEPSPPAASEMTGTVNVASLPSDPAPASDLIDLNTASFEQLNAIRGVGSVARAIIKKRPYASVEDLVKRKVIRRSVYEKLKDQVAVR
jgi:DNA uptake protein ComE-like DNA-binding protein